MAAAAHEYGARDAYVEQDGTRIGFDEWYRRSRALAAHLRGRGVDTGDVVALMLPSGIDYAVAYAAVALLGAVTTGINTRLGPREVTSILAQAMPTLVIRDTDSDLPEIDGATPVLTRAELNSVTRSDAADFLPEAPGLGAPVTIIFTSGTTGLPKGAWFDGENMAAAADSAGVMSAPLDRRLTSTPFPHAGYMAKLWDQFIWGITLVVSPVPWSAEKMRDILIRERITVAGGVPTQWTKLLDGAQRDSFPDLRLGVVATAPASPELVERTAELIGVPLVVRYAMTEAPSVSGTAIDDPPDVAFRTVGKPQTGMDVRITDDAGAELPAGRVGRVRIRGACVMRGYWNDSKRTSEAFDEDGWFVSGDLGSVTDEGHLMLAGRVGDMYIRGGFKVHPVEVDHVLTEHPGVKEAAVVGYPVPVLGEIGVAFVVPTESSSPPTSVELRRWTADRLADYKSPDHLVIVDALPLTAMNKVDRHRLRALAAATPPPPR
ncbi:class I adenylate-forming enzyme family protein [Dietzia psychralcaliphila]|uniref:class I adenylate-forming enzyme family protein n=1 Tax=Dietzia psychralcaliphila TaxID=139021 RepID=UPI001C1DE7A5|nr:class I adenylate-forming enzyme family protein [Dietzia psychralcaliphila]